MKEYIREDLKDLKPYIKTEGDYNLRLDANESPFDLPLEVRATLATELLNNSHFNRYPDPYANCLRDKLAAYLKVQRDNIVIGNGSDELIQVIVSAFAGAGDTVLYPEPSFEMYSKSAMIAGAICAEYRLGDQFKYNVFDLEKTIRANRPKIVFICSPNNPTGNTMEINDILYIARRFSCIVVVDEAYYEFSGETAIKYISSYPNLIILRTFSKAVGMAGLRIGYLVCNSDLASQIGKIKPLFNVNAFSQRAAELMLDHIDIIGERTQSIIEFREWLYNALDGLRGVEPLPSKSNFILLKVKNGEAVFRGLMAKGILVKHYIGHPILNNYLRVTIGLKEDNVLFLKSLAEILSNMDSW